MEEKKELKVDSVKKGSSALAFIIGLLIGFIFGAAFVGLVI